MFQAILADMPAEMMVHLASGRDSGGAPVPKPLPGAGGDPDVVGAVQDDTGAVPSAMPGGFRGAARRMAAPAATCSDSSSRSDDDLRGNALPLSPGRSVSYSAKSVTPLA
jgi:hypothetical protein